jgi:hypothetical protein
MTIRPSTARLDLNLRALAAEFSVRDMGCMDVSLFLGCSPSSARNYINRLLDAGIVVTRRTAAACGRTTVSYRARPNAGVTDLPAIAEPRRAAPAPVRAGGAGADQRPDATPRLRDPLVAAFFGSVRS